MWSGDPPLAHLIHHVQNCDWYWGDLDWKCAKKMLVLCAPGTFLLRDSRSDTSIFSLSYRTSDKVLHSRADDLLLKAAKLNNTQISPLNAFEHLVQRCNGRDLEMLLYQKDNVFANINFSLTVPLRKRDCIPSLAFLSRELILKNLELIEAAQSHLPSPIAQYVFSKSVNPSIEECISVLRQRAALR